MQHNPTTQKSNIYLIIPRFSSLAVLSWPCSTWKSAAAAAAAGCSRCRAYASKLQPYEYLLVRNNETLRQKVAPLAFVVVDSNGGKATLWKIHVLYLMIAFRY